MTVIDLDDPTGPQVRPDSGPSRQVEPATAAEQWDPSPEPTTSWLPAGVAAILAAIATGSSAVSWMAIFATPVIVGVACAGAAAFGAAIGLALHRKRFASTLTGAAALVAAGLALGEPRGLATRGLLLSADPSLVALPVAVVAAGTLLATAAVLRQRQLALGFVAVGAAHTVAGAYTVSERPASFGLVVLVVLLTVAAALAGRIARGAQVRLVPALGVSSAAALGVAVAWLPGGGRAVDLRERLDAPVTVLDANSPLSMVKAGLVEEEPEEVFTIAVDDLPDGEVIDRLTVAVLDRYDGAVWSSSVEFVRAGERLPRIRQQGLTGPEVAFSVELAEQYPFRQLPLPGTLRGIESGDLLWDDVSGMVIAADADAVAFSGTAALSAVDRSAEGSPSGVGGYTELPEPVPTFVDDFIRSRLSGQDERDWLDQLEAELRGADFGYNEFAPGGHSLAALERFVVGDDERVSQGFAEQGAAAFALVARRLGLPARIAVGYRLDEPITTSGDAVVVTEDQIDAWPEVWINGVGWMAFEPTNRDNPVEQAADRPAISQGQASSEPTSVPDLSPPEYLPGLEQEAAGWRPPTWLAAVVGLPVLTLAAIIVAKRLRRRRRRRSADPGERIVGAWADLADALRDAGRHPAPNGTVIDLRDRLLENAAIAADSGKIDDSLTALSSKVDRAIYAPDTPSVEDADEAWAASGAVKGELRAQWSARDRMRAALSPWSLFTRR